MSERRPGTPPDTPRPELPARVTLPLLTLITQQSLDEDYLHAAERRASGATPPRTPGLRGRHRTAAVVVAVFGILVTTAAVQTSRNADVDDASRATLLDRIGTKRDTVSRLQDEIVRFRTRNVTLEGQLAQVTRTEQASEARLRRLETATGFGAVTGEGVRIVVDDAPDGDATQTVRDEDLALLVDGLWGAGAEAISINGQRITALTAIRNAGIAINVNTRPLSPPYVVQAIGDTRTLQADFLSTTHGQEFTSLAQQLGFVFERQNEDRLTLPPQRLRPLRSVLAGTAEDNSDKHLEEESKP
ncbi:DUF881 domain-containing protein [Nocardioides sp. KIGAM211]|uniref:DUF881 domain-containing protein n=1 Tax=Nocardioides luti TaxID=2761101 RepID=A0A7X0RCE6_9ACTN|nr:DUF881 domain-containing protein [Nocardioides luti]MBB6625747.1 DUF881 domain-containing protein [Nocardioides luti]